MHGYTREDLPPWDKGLLGMRMCAPRFSAHAVHLSERLVRQSEQPSKFGWLDRIPSLERLWIGCCCRDVSSSSRTLNLGYL